MYAMPKIHISNNILAKTRRGKYITGASFNKLYYRILFLIFYHFFLKKQKGFPQKLDTFEKNFKENTSFLIK